MIKIIIICLLLTGCTTLHPYITFRSTTYIHNESRMQSDWYKEIKPTQSGGIFINIPLD